MPTTSLLAPKVWIGDKWQFDVIFNDIAGNPIVVDTTDNIPGGMLFAGTQKAGIPLVFGQTIDIGNGTLLPTVEIIDGNNGRVRYTVHAIMYVNVKFTSSSDTATIFNHLQTFLVDIHGERVTQVVTDLDVDDPRSMDGQSITAGNPIIAVTGPQGRPGTGANMFVYTTQTPLTIWPIHHNLNFYPNIILIDTANDVFYADIVYVDSNVVNVYMTAPTTGSAHLS